jgi:hypothetical protein
MVIRNPAGNAKLLKDQHDLLKDSVNDFFAGVEAKAIEIAVRIRTLVHETSSSHAFLATIDSNYRNRDIYRRIPPSKKVVFAIPAGIQMSGDGTAKFIKDDFGSGQHELVTLEQWWTDEYLIIGNVRSSKKDVVLDVSNKDGGAHVDPKVPARHAAASEPPFQFGVNANFVRPNLARVTVAQAGNELLDYLERHFSAYLVSLQD